MENSTKIYLGVGAAALVAFLLLRNKAAAQKPAETNADNCPAGQIRIQPNCIKAPCNSYCQPIDDFRDGGILRSNDEDYGYKKECPAGTKPCVNNPSKCVSTNPDIIYIADPCKY